MKKFSTFAFLIMSFFLSAVHSFALPQMNPPSYRPIMRSDTGRLLAVLKAKQEELKITDEQMNKIEQLTFKTEDMLLEFRNKTASLQLELRRQIQNNENMDYEKIKSLITQSAELRADSIITRMKLRNDIKNILTKEQFTTLKGMIKDILMHRRLLERRYQPERNTRVRRPGIHRY
jgi:Spy/CpxP family protein refolding chaperone